MKKFIVFYFAVEQISEKGFSVFNRSWRDTPANKTFVKSLEDLSPTAVISGSEQEKAEVKDATFEALTKEASQLSPIWAACLKQTVSAESEEQAGELFTKKRGIGKTEFVLAFEVEAIQKKARTLLWEDTPKTEEKTSVVEKKEPAPKKKEKGGEDDSKKKS